MSKVGFTAEVSGKCMTDSYSATVQFARFCRSAYATPLLLGLILCVATGVRVHNIHLPGPYFDDVYYSNAAKHFLQQEPLGALSSVTIGGIWFPLTFSPHTGTLTVYIEAAFMAVTGNLRHLDRYLNTGYALVAIVLAYALAARLLGRGYALLLAWILAVLPSFVFWSRVGNHLIFFRSVIGAAFFYLTFRWLDTRENKVLYLLAFVVGLGLSTRIEAAWLAVGFLVLAVIDGDCRTAVGLVIRSPRVLLITLASGLIGGFLFVGNQLANNFPILRQIARNADVTLYGHANTAITTNLSRRAEHIAGLFRGNLFPEYGPTYSNLLWPALLLGSAIFLLYLALPKTAPKLASEKNRFDVSLFSRSQSW
jgi:4-amino-4-deoxy-L-arabinose transferase-like glycosyltransferase